MNFAKHISSDRRLAILRLMQDTGYTANDSILHEALGQLGHVCPRDVVRDDLTWLAERELVTVEIVAERVWVARLTERGGDVASGRARVEGVKRPSPRG